MLSLQQSHKEYLIAIFINSKRNKGGWVSNTDISKFLGVKPASVTGMLQKLYKQGLVNWKPRKRIRLTDKGKLIAKEKIEIYTLIKGFFIKYLDIRDDPSLDLLCSKIEHYIPPKVLDALKVIMFK